MVNKMIETDKVFKRHLDLLQKIEEETDFGSLEELQELDKLYDSHSVKYQLSGIYVKMGMDESTSSERGIDYEEGMVTETAEKYIKSAIELFKESKDKKNNQYETRAQEISDLIFAEEDDLE